jgi:hypothetical protein
MYVYLIFFYSTICLNVFKDNGLPTRTSCFRYVSFSLSLSTDDAFVIGEIYLVNW